MILLGHDTAVAEYVASIGGKPFLPPYTAIGALDKTGHLQGGAVFTGYNGNSIEISLAGRGAATRAMMAAVIAYVFGQLKCTRLQMHTNRRNKHVLRMLAGRRGPGSGLGVHYEGVARRFYGKDDAVMYSLTADDVVAFRKRWRLP